ncbi:hypothetical protein TRVA0_038S01134 [Trichomonascus vanleenenianus]|uniref:uncharacterized protein n=1 Tax=Trichomonascus vanleenenianus TaxID=2268995 RepID=UPI003ECA220C
MEERDYISDSDWGGYEQSIIHESDNEDGDIGTITESNTDDSLQVQSKKSGDTGLYYQRNLRAREFKQLKPYSYVKEHFKSVFGDRSRGHNQSDQHSTTGIRSSTRDQEVPVVREPSAEEADTDVPLRDLVPDPIQPPNPEPMDIDMQDELEDEIDAIFGPRDDVDHIQASNGSNGNIKPLNSRGTIGNSTPLVSNGTSEVAVNEIRSPLSQRDLEIGWNRRRLRPRQEDQLHPYQADAQRYGKVRITEASQDYEYSPSSSENEEEIFNLDNPIHSDGSMSSPEPSLSIAAKGRTELQAEPRRDDLDYDSLDDNIDSIFGRPPPPPTPPKPAPGPKPLSEAQSEELPFRPQTLDRVPSGGEAMEADSIAQLTAKRSRRSGASQARRSQGTKTTRRRKNKVSIVDYLDETSRTTKKRPPRFSRVAAASVRRKKNVRRDNISRKYISISSSDEHEQSEPESSEWISRVNTLLRGNGTSAPRATRRPNEYSRRPAQRSITDFLSSGHTVSSNASSEPAKIRSLRIPRRKSNRAVKVVRTQAKPPKKRVSPWVTTDAEAETGKYAIGRNHYASGPSPDFLTLIRRYPGTSDQLSTSVLPYPKSPRPERGEEQELEIGLESPANTNTGAESSVTKRHGPPAGRKFVRKSSILSGHQKITKFLTTSNDISSFGIDPTDRELHFDASSFVNSLLFSAVVNYEDWFQLKPVFEYYDTIISVFDDELTVRKALDSCASRITNTALSYGTDTITTLNQQILSTTEELFEFLIGAVAAKKFDRLVILPFLECMGFAFAQGNIPPESFLYRLRLICYKYCFVLRFLISDTTLDDERDQFLDSAQLLLRALLEESALYDMLQSSRRFKTITRGCVAIESAYVLLTLLNQVRHSQVGFSALLSTIFILGPFSPEEVPVYDRIWLTIFLFTKFGRLAPFRPQLTSEWGVIIGLISKLKDHFASSSDIVESAAYFDKCLLRSLVLIVRFGWCGNPDFIQRVFEIFKDRMFKNFSPPHVDTIPDFLLKTLTPKNPNFLKQLSPRPHESSFHLFLKIYILTLSRTDLPVNQINLLNGRTILQKKRHFNPSEEFVEFEASSLANDFWFNAVKFVYSPPDRRPNILSIKNRVDLTDSHVKAKLLSSRAWFVVSRIAIGQKEYSKQVSQWLNELVVTATSDIEASIPEIGQVFSEMLRNIRQISSDVGIITNPQWPVVLFGSIGPLVNMKAAPMKLKLDVLETLYSGVQLYDNVRYLDDASTSDDFGVEDSIAGPLSEQVNQVHFIQFLDAVLIANMDQLTVERILTIYARFALLFIQSGKDWPYMLGEWAQNGFCWSYLNHNDGRRIYQAKWLALVLSNFNELNALSDLEFFSTTFVRPFCINFIQNPSRYTLEFFQQLKRLPPWRERLAAFQNVSIFSDMMNHREAILCAIIPSVSRSIIIDIINSIKSLSLESIRNFNEIIASIRKDYPSLGEAYNLKTVSNHTDDLRRAIALDDKPRVVSLMMKVLAESLVDYNDTDWRTVYLELIKRDRPKDPMIRLIFVDIVRCLLNSANESARVVELLMLEELLRLAYMVLRNLLTGGHRLGQSLGFKMVMAVLSYAKTSTRRTLWLVVAPVARLARDWAISADTGTGEYLDAVVESFSDLLIGSQSHLRPPRQFEVEQFVHAECVKAMSEFEWSDNDSTWMFKGKEVKLYDEQAYRETAIQDIIELLSIRCRSTSAAQKARQGLNTAMLATLARWNDLFNNDDDRTGTEIDNLVI